jgi:hypothetical protein
LIADGAEVARATTLRIRSADIPWPSRTAGGDTARPFDGPEAAKPFAAPWSGDHPAAYHSTATEHRVIRGTWGALGPSTDWIRLRLPVVAGETPSPFQRVAAVADFGNGISSALPFGVHRFINPDLTITLHRLRRRSGSASTRRRTPSRTASASPERLVRRSVADRPRGADVAAGTWRTRRRRRASRRRRRRPCRRPRRLTTPAATPRPTPTSIWGCTTIPRVRRRVLR